MYNADAYIEGYEAGRKDKADGVVASKACKECHAMLAGKDMAVCPRCDGIVVTLDDAATLYAQAYLDAVSGYAPVFTKGTTTMRTIIVLAALLLSAPAYAQTININPNTGAGDDSSDITLDQHSEVSTETDNSTSVGDVTNNTTHEGQSDKHAERAAASVSFSAPGDGPCGDSTGISAQSGVVGFSAATVTDTCRASRIAALVSNERVPRRFKWAAEAIYWFGFPSRLVLAIVSGGTLN